MCIRTETCTRIRLEALFVTAENNPDVFQCVNRGDLRHEMRLPHKSNRLVTQQPPRRVSKALQTERPVPAACCLRPSTENATPSWRISAVARGYGWGEVCPKAMAGAIWG